MRKILEILRLRWVLGLTVRETSAAVGVSTGAVSRTTERAHAAELSYEGASELGHEELDALLYPSPARTVHHVSPDPSWVHRELRRLGVTLELLHQEYRAEHGEHALGYSAFCRRYQSWRSKRGPVLRQHYVGGEVLFVDFSGKRPTVADAQTGAARAVELFVAVMGASNFTYVEAVETQRVEDWIGAHTRALDYLGGAPRRVVPDQLRAAVSEPDRHEPKLQRTYEDLGRHYGMAVIPARPRKPRDKAKVEAGVLVAQRWILARLRDETFFSLEALNRRIRELLEDLNDRPMKSLGGVSRRELFERVDRPALMSLPASRFEPAQWSKARVHEDYHVDVQRHWYSAPFELIGQEVEVRLTAAMVELYLHGRRVASHRRDDTAYQSTTDPRHRPPNHQAVFEGTRDQLMKWAVDVGASTQELMRRLLDPDHNFSGTTRRRSGYGVRSSRRSTSRRALKRRVVACWRRDAPPTGASSASCDSASTGRARRKRRRRRRLSNTTRSEELTTSRTTRTRTRRTKMLREPTMEKLYALRLAVMAMAWEQQEKEPKLRELDFGDRFGLLVEAEHRARDNRRLARLLKTANLRITEACMEDLEAGPDRGLPATTIRQLATGAWVGERLNVLVSGATGVGKSYLACALGQMVCRQGLTVLYQRVPRLFEELRIAKAEGSYARRLAKMAKADVLILDDLGLGHLDETQRHDLLEVLEDRYGKHSTVVTSQLPIKKWHEWIGDPTVADAILDRLVHNAYKVHLKGPSRRKVETPDTN